MNKPIEIVLNTIAAAAADLTVVGGVIGIDDYSFPWKKMFSAEKQLSVAEVASTPTATVVGSVAGTEYFFYISQWIGGTLEQHRISVIAGATATATAALFVAQINAIASSGGGSRLKATAANVAGVVTVTSTAGFPLMTLSNSSSTVVALVAVGGTAAVNSGANLLLEGIKDSFDGDLPLSGKVYTSYELTLMLPKGSGGFNEQTSDQEHTLMLYLETTATNNYAALVLEIDKLLAGTDGLAWNFSAALAV